MTLRFNDEGSQLAGGFFDGTLRIYNTDTNKLQHLTRGKEAIPVIKKKSDDYYDDRDLEEDFKPMDALKESGEASLTAVRWLPGNSKVNIVSTVDTQGIVALWEVPHYKRGAGAVPKLLHRIEGSAEKKAVEGMCFTNDGTKVLIGGADKFIKAFDIEKLKMSNEQMYGHKAPAPEKIAGHALKIVAMEAHPVEANVFFSGGLDRKVCIWDLRMETPAGVIHGCDVSGDAIKCSNKNKLLVASHRSQDPFQIHDLRKIGSKASEKPGVSPSASPRSPLSPATDDPDRVDLWESTGHKSYDWRGDETPFEKRAAPTMCLPFSASWDEDCKIMVSCGEQENFARIYELPDNNAADRLSVVGTYYGSNASFLTAAVSRDGKNVAFGSGAGGLLFLEVRL
jgi:WD40 repeat protein